MILFYAHIKGTEIVTVHGTGSNQKNIKFGEHLREKMAEHIPGTGDEYEKKSKKDSYEYSTDSDTVYVYCLWK